jgi:hypothetical protein
MRLKSSSDITSESILNELEAIDLGLVKIVVERVTVVKLRMDYGSGNGGGSFEVNIKDGCDVDHGCGKNSLKGGKRSGG